MAYKPNPLDRVSSFDIKIPENDVVSLCRKNYLKFVAKTAFVDLETQEKWTFGDFDTKHIKFNQLLEEVGVRPLDRVMVVVHNSYDYVVIVFAILSLKACAVLAPQQNTLDDLSYFLSVTSCKFVITSKDFAQNVMKITANPLTFVEQVLMLTDDSLECLKHPMCSVPNSNKKNSENIENFHIPSHQLPALILFSSGTTGRPKGVVLSHTSIVSSITKTNYPTLSTFEDRNNSILYQPMAHGYGITRTIFGLLAGITTLLLKKFKLPVFLKTIEDYKVQSLNLVPSIVVMLITSDETYKYDLSSIRFLYSSAASLKKEVERKVITKFPNVRVLQGYALTECGGLVTQTPLDEDAPLQGAVGSLFPNTICRVMDPESKRIQGPYEKGEILVRSSSNMMGYFNNPEATRDTIDSEGFIHTGDYGYFNKKGCFFITDRIKELIKYMGKQVAPAELEAILLTHECIKEAAVVGLPSELHGELPRALIVLKENTKCTEEEIIKWFNERVAPHKHLRGGVKFIDSIPKTQSGKIMRKFLKESIEKSKL